MLQTAAMALPVAVALGLASGNNRAGDGLAPRGVFPPPASESEDGVGPHEQCCPLPPRMGSPTATPSMIAGRTGIFISPNHALLIDGVLIRVKELVNGISIAPARPAERERTEYLQSMLDTHEVIGATQSAPAQSFLLKDGNHENFTNFADYERLSWPLAPCCDTFRADRG